MKPETMAAIEAHAIEQYPQESCGLVVSEDRKEFYVPCRNVASNPLEEFAIGKDDWVAAELQGEVVMVAHSHPNASARPTPLDQRVCEALGLAWCIVAVHGDPADAVETPRVVDSCIFEPTGYEMPYRGREFKFGTVDCYTLVQDWYRLEKDIILPHFDRVDKFWEPEMGEQDLYMENMAANGFVEVPTPSQPGDLIMMGIRSNVVNHAGIWLGEQNFMLHHPYLHLSERTVFGGYWVENLRYIMRKVQ